MSTVFPPLWVGFFVTVDIDINSHGFINVKKQIVSTLEFAHRINEQNPVDGYLQASRFYCHLIRQTAEDWLGLFMNSPS